MVGTEISSPVEVQRPESAERSPQTPSSIRELHSTSPIKMSDEYASIELLKEWPMITATLENGKKLYESAKGSNAFIAGSLDVTEKFIKFIASSSFSLLKKVPLVVEQADIIANDSLEFLQNRFPVVKESPEQVYEAIRKRVDGLVKPVIRETEAITEIGRNGVKKTFNTVTTVCRKAIAAVDEWVNKLGSDIQEESKMPTASQSSAAPGTSSQGAPGDSKASPGGSRSKVLGVARTGVAAAKTVGFFYVGLGIWALSRVPVIGRAFNTSHDPSVTAAAAKETTSTQQ